MLKIPLTAVGVFNVVVGIAVAHGGSSWLHYILALGIIILSILSLYIVKLT